MERKKISFVWEDKEILKKRIILLVGEITREKAIDLRKKLLFLNSQSTEKEITLIIDTPGGEVVSAFIIYEILKLSRAPVVAIVNGECSSSGILVLQGAKKRLATKSSFFYLHPFSISFEKEPISLDRTAERKIKEKLRGARERQKFFYEILIGKTKKTLQEIKRIEGKIIFAKEGKEIGLIDEVIEDFKKYKIPKI